MEILVLKYFNNGVQSSVVLLIAIAWLCQGNAVQHMQKDRCLHV